jgi:hypothetical protein
MRRNRWFVASALAGLALLAGACITPPPVTHPTTTTTSSTTTSSTTTSSTTTTTLPDDPNGRYVATTGSDTSDCSSSAAPCATIGYATGQAAAGNTVYVAAGTYPEVVSVDRNLTYRGANADIDAGVNTGTRGAESVVKGFRNPGNPGTTAIDVTINGFQIDPQGDTTLLGATSQALVWLRGGSTGVTVEDNVFNGGPYSATCSFTCTTMTDNAIRVNSGTVTIKDNAITNFRRAVYINQTVGAPALHSTVSGNAFSGITSLGVSLGGATSVQMPGQTVTGNTFDATSSTGGPAGITVSNGGNAISDNTFNAFSSGVYIDLCKKFNTDNNGITGNTFTANAAGVFINVNSDGGQCVSSNTEGSGGWVVGAGQLNGLTISQNSFVGNTTAGVVDEAYNWTFWNAAHPAITTTAADVTCNWWNSSTGPANVDVHSSGTSVTPVADQLVYSAAPQAPFNYSPWLTSQGGACNGS